MQSEMELAARADEQRPLLSGDGPPARKVGTTGDLYVDLAGRRLYGPKSFGHWREGEVLVGKKPRKRTPADDLPLATSHGLILTTNRGGALAGDQS